MFFCKDCGTEINEGEYKTFGVCDNCWDKVHPQNLAEPDEYSLLAEVRADLQRLLFFAMDRNDGWDDELSEKIKEIINKVS